MPMNMPMKFHVLCTENLLERKCSDVIGCKTTISGIILLLYLSFYVSHATLC